MAEQIPFGTGTIGLVPSSMSSEPRCPCVLLLDTSGSMGEVVSNVGTDLGYTFQKDGKTFQAVSGGTTRIDLLNEGIRAYHADLMSDKLAPKRVEPAVITFGGTVQTVSPFVTAQEFAPPTLTADGETPMGEAILKAIEAVEERKRHYKQNALHFFRPWILLITDGEPTDAWQEAAEKVKEGEKNKKFAFFSVGVEGANFDTLQKISTTRAPLRLKGNCWREMFLWLSSSQRSVSQSSPGQEDQVKLASPVGWANL